MKKSEIIKELSKREVNINVNNYLFKNCISNDIIEEIPDFCEIAYDTNDINRSFAYNIKIDFSKTQVCDIFSYTLNIIKENKKLESMDCKVLFESKIDVLKFVSILRKYNCIVQFICYNFESITKEELELINELYSFNSPFFNISSFIRKDFSLSFLKSDFDINIKKDNEKSKQLKKELITKN